MNRFFLSILSSWRNPKRLPIPNHAELVEKVAVLSERIARLSERIARQEPKLGRLERQYEAISAAGDRNSLNTFPDVIQPLRPGDVIATAPTPVSERPWERKGWLHPEGGWCWYNQGIGRDLWIKVNPNVHALAKGRGWQLPHYAIPSIPEAWLRDHSVPAPGAAGVQP